MPVQEGLSREEGAVCPEQGDLGFSGFPLVNVRFHLSHLPQGLPLIGLVHPTGGWSKIAGPWLLAHSTPQEAGLRLQGHGCWPTPQEADLRLQGHGCYPTPPHRRLV
ncbi:hypothetical protein PoB_005526100 [Plakobranchus ocellatus]|uniref:Uncharacterized protein n=1 Tax=Plakobranchus ocellatus TaxID=259542 RepID=A0AAV4CBM3_9GAST|nr:hypothetical protein PoB_005526100 [Plakobranchus ocellatus]